MILPITLYGNPILRKEVEEVETGSANQELKQLVEDMFDTMYHANGVGLAAPQVNKSLALFVIDTEAFLDEGDTEKAVKKAFVNPEITETSENRESARTVTGKLLVVPDAHIDAVALQAVRQLAEIRLAVMVGEQHLWTDAPRRQHNLFRSHGVGLVAWQEGNICVFDAVHFRNVLGVTGNVDAQPSDGEDIAVVVS